MGGVGDDAAGRARSARDIQENNVVGRSRKRARGEGLNRENPGMGGGKRRSLPQSQGRGCL